MHWRRREPRVAKQLEFFWLFPRAGFVEGPEVERRRGRRLLWSRCDAGRIRC